MIKEFKALSKKEKWGVLSPAVFLSLAISFTLFIYAPLSLYFTNKQDFWFDFYDVMPVVGLMFGLCLLALLVIYGILFLIHKRAYYIGIAVGFTALICSYIQGNFMTGYLPILDGAVVDWDSLAIHRISSIALWVITGLVVFGITKFFKFKGLGKVVDVISVMFMGIFLAILIWVGIRDNAFAKKDNYCVTTNNITTYANEDNRNFIIFLVDATDASAVNRIFQEDGKYYEALRDFTYYNNVSGMFPYTDHSIPYILSGDRYECEEDFYDYVSDVYKTSPLFDRLRSENYEIDLYEPLVPTYDGEACNFDNVENIEASFGSISEAMKIQLQLIGFRYFPFDLKQFCEVAPGDISVTQTTGRDDIRIFDDKNPFFMNIYHNDAPTYVDNNVFKFVHVEGAHAPFTYDEDMNVVAPEEGSYDRNVRATMNMVIDYIDYLKSVDAYDNSVIIVMADHGCTQTREWFQKVNPVFMVKGLNETRGGMYITDAPISYADLMGAYDRLLTGSSAADIFDWHDGDVRVRDYIRCYSMIDTDMAGDVVYPYDIEEEYRVEGHASAWFDTVPTGKIFIRDRVSIKNIFDRCFVLTRSYGRAIILFTLLCKILMTPISIWIQKNSIKMVKMQPEINEIKIKYYGDSATINQKISELYKREKYKMWATIVPTILQLAILLLMVDIINGIGQRSMEVWFLGYDIMKTGAQNSDMMGIMAPLAAGVSALIMCVCQNIIEVLQQEQSRKNQIMVTAVSVGISVILGRSVKLGVIIYWIVSNLYAAIWVFVINWLINPKKYVDYEKLEKTKKELAALESLGGKKKLPFADANAKREKADYKRFLSIKNKHLVFYSESNGFFKYYKGFINEILEHSDIPIHYVTNDPNDNIFKLAEEKPQIKPYYIGEKKLITLMMKMDSDVVIMTVPDLENFHIKRSYIRKDIDYMLIQHGVGSLNLLYRKGSMDHYDTIFCVGPLQKEEVQKIENVYNLPKKVCLECGYPLIDDMIADFDSKEHPENVRKKILIAPSWKEDNIIDTCLENILNSIKDKPYDIIVRPHPQHVRHCPQLFEGFKEKYKDVKNIEIQTDFSSNNPVMEADILMTDWSDISWEYAFTTKRPVIFIDTNMPALNEDWQKIDTVPMNIALRNIVGRSVAIEETDKMGDIVEQVLKDKEKYREAILKAMDDNMYNIGNSAYVGGKFIIDTIVKKIEERRNNNESK